MPFTAEGIQPDIIINPCCIPSRMTVGQLLECVVSKYASMEGTFIDATPFETVDMDTIRSKLSDYGYDDRGYEYLYNGMTGQKMRCAIFIGPTYYMRLKHMVNDKVHSRGRGPKQNLTHQPPEGRAKDGGLRLGEMERDSLLSHGTSVFLKERFMECSDKYSIKVCNNCGLFAAKLINKDVWGCNACKNYTDISHIQIPYAFKLLVQELQAINILPRIKTKKNIYTDGK